MMNRFFCSFLVLLIAFNSQAQRVYFAYFQTENDQPFFIKMNEKITSSTATGYLILPKLKDSSYAVTIGFPQAKFPEQRFRIEVKSRDHGYLIKNFADKGWGLFDLQTLGVQMSTTNMSSTKAELKDPSMFTDILAKASNDPSLREKPRLISAEDKIVAPQQALTITTVPPVAMEDKNVTVIEKKPTDSTAIGTIIPDENIIPRQAVTMNEKPVLLNDQTVSEKAYVRSTIIRKSESSTSEGFGLNFIDIYEDGRQDTIHIIIPNATSAFASDKQGTALPLISANCKAVAVENDFMKLRKKMAAASDNDAMIGEAKKIWKTRCITTAMTKNLGSLFNDDAGKYLFYDAAYSHVSDPENYPTLESELKETYFVNRFKTLLK